MKEENNADDLKKRVADLIGREPASQFAKRLGVSVGAIQGILTKGSMPRMDTLRKMAEVNKVSLCWLILGQEHEPWLPQPPKSEYAAVAQPEDDAADALSPERAAYLDAAGDPSLTWDAEQIRMRCIHVRNADSYTQKDFATLLGIQPSYVCMVEKGQKDYSMAVLARIIKQFGLSPNWLLYGIGDMLFSDLTAQANPHRQQQQQALVDFIDGWWQRYYPKRQYRLAWLYDLFRSHIPEFQDYTKKAWDMPREKASGTPQQ